MEFIDPISSRACRLVLVDGDLGVEHPDCDQLADVLVELDAFYCPTCTWNGRVAGALVIDMLQAP